MSLDSMFSLCVSGHIVQMPQEPDSDDSDSEPDERPSKPDHSNSVNKQSHQLPIVLNAQYQLHTATSLETFPVCRLMATAMRYAGLFYCLRC